jgi:quercetin dioxygenase-like cupin family protein
MITDIEIIDKHCEVQFFESDKLFAKRYVMGKGDKIGKHIHTYSHLSILGYGSVRVDTPDGSRVYESGDCIVIKANTEHFVTALEDTCWFCVHTDKE